MKSTKSSFEKVINLDQQVGSYQKETNSKKLQEPPPEILMHETKVLSLEEGYSLYIKGLNKDSTTKDIRKLFSPFGSIKVSKTSGTTATIEFKRKFKAKQAMTKLNGATVKDHSIIISMTNEGSTRMNNSISCNDCKYPNRNSVWDDIDIIPIVWNENDIKPEWEKIDIKPFNINNHINNHNNEIQVEQEIVHTYEDSPPSQHSSSPRLVIDSNVQSPINSLTSYEDELGLISRFSHGTYIHATMDERFKEFNENAWEIISTEDVTINPYNQLNLLVKISYWNLAHTIEYTTHQTKFFITCGLCPYPQVIEGMYETKNTLVTIMVRNSSKIMLTFKMGEPIKAFSAHTHEFVTQSLKQYSEQPEYLGQNYKLTQ